MVPPAIGGARIFPAVLKKTLIAPISSTKRRSALSSQGAWPRPAALAFAWAANAQGVIAPAFRRARPSRRGAVSGGGEGRRRKKGRGLFGLRLRI
jgi:hypothetical protein